MLLLNLVQLFHMINDFLLSIYILIFPKKYDIYYSIYLALIFLHWNLLKNECLLSYIEKKLIDKKYVLGSNPYFHPYRKYFSSYMCYLVDFLRFLNMVIVFIRNDNIFIRIILSFLIGLSIYSTYKVFTKCLQK